MRTIFNRHADTWRAGCVALVLGAGRIAACAIIRSIADVTHRFNDAAGLTGWASAARRALGWRAGAMALVVRRYNITAGTIIRSIAYMPRCRGDGSGLASWASGGGRLRFGCNASCMAGIAKLANFDVTRWADTEILARDATNLSRWAWRRIGIAGGASCTCRMALVGFRDLVAAQSVIAAIADMFSVYQNLSRITRWARLR